jgi:hypothetical protein
MEAAPIRYELRVGTVVSEAALATFRGLVRPTAVPRHTLYRLRVSADRDLSEVLHLLTERAVEVLEIRRCVEPRPRNDGTAGAGQQQMQEADPGAVGVVLPFRRGMARPADGSRL